MLFFEVRDTGAPGVGQKLRDLVRGAPRPASGVAGLGQKFRDLIREVPDPVRELRLFVWKLPARELLARKIPLAHDSRSALAGTAAVLESGRLSPTGSGFPGIPETI
jgi:hypothetical protein